MRPRRVLVVDDDLSQRQVLCRHLGLRHFEGIPSDFGLDALTRISSLHPDLVLADISMPHIDGVQLLKIMRSTPQTATIPVILMTGMPYPEGLLEAAADGLKAGPIHRKGDFLALFKRIDNIFDCAPIVADESEPPVLVFHKGMIKVDVIHRDVVVGGKTLRRLSAKRFDLLLSLLRHDGPVEQDELLSDVWSHRGDLKAVQMTVSRLRDDLKAFPALQIKTDAHTYQLIVAAQPNDSGN